MTQFDYKFNKGLSLVWLLVAVCAVFGAFWKGAWHQLLLAVIGVTMYVVMRPKKWVHIPMVVYNDLNERIALDISDMCDECKESSVDADVKDGIFVRISFRITQKETRTKFRDDAWGASKIFTEYNWEAGVEILNVAVLDENDKALDSDFDEDLIETEYETTEWR